MSEAGRTSPAGTSSAFVGAAALVSGYPAWKIAQLLGPVIGRLDCAPERRAEFAQALAVLGRAGAEWLQEVERATPSVVGSAEVPSAPRSPSWGDAMTAMEVAQVLGVSVRQVLNLTERLGGRQQRRKSPWVFSRADVLAYQEGRSA